MPAKTKILLTGASGFLGSAIMESLSGSYEVITMGRGTGNARRIDLSTNVPELNESFELVIHAAGKAHMIPRTAVEKEDFIKVNVTGTQNLLLGFNKSGKFPLHFVFISTVAVYGLESGDLIDEQSALAGITPYAKSKIESEEYLKSWADKNNVILTILRLPLVIGKNPKGNLGAMVKMMRRGLYIGTGDGASRKSMVLADDVAKFIPRVARIGGIFNLTDGYHPSMLELEMAVSSQLKRKEPFRFPLGILKVAARLGDQIGNLSPINSDRLGKLVTSLTFSDTRARREAGWNPGKVIDNLPPL